MTRIMKGTETGAEEMEEWEAKGQLPRHLVVRLVHVHKSG